jgi:hypothetical protein
VSKCHLCGNEARLAESHILPAFVARWVKDTSATGYLRGFHAPNRRKQDFPTKRLLCDECERRFSGAETKFAQSVFVPFHDGRSRFEYSGWLLYFAVSLAWRCLATSNRSELERYPQHVEPVDRARDALAAFLLGNADRVRPYRLNLFFTPAGATSSSELPEGLGWYSLRGTDMTPVYSRAKAATYAKLPGMFFWMSIVPPDPGGWKGTRIGRHGTFRAKNQVLAEPGVGDFLNDRVKTVYKQLTNLSPVQKQRMEESLRRDPERAAQSRTLEAWLDDERIRSDNLLKPK